MRAERWSNGSLGRVSLKVEYTPHYGVFGTVTACVIRYRAVKLLLRWSDRYIMPTKDCVAGALRSI